MDLAGCKIVTGVLPCWLHIRNRNYDDSRLLTKTVEGRFSRCSRKLLNSFGFPQSHSLLILSNDKIGFFLSSAM